MKKFIVFGLVFMFFQNFLMFSEINSYLNMVTDIQGYKFNAFKNLHNNFSLKIFLIYIVLYLFLLYIIYDFVIKEHKSYFKGFMLLSCIYFTCDFNIFVLFDKTLPHLPVLFYDTFIVGGLCIVITQYLIYNYYDILKKYIWLLCILFIFSFLFILYGAYQYNPDLSNIKGIVLL
jgi:hypothetical protein